MAQQPLTYSSMVRDTKVLVKQATLKAVLGAALGYGSALSEHIISNAVMRSFMRTHKPSSWSLGTWWTLKCTEKGHAAIPQHSIDSILAASNVIVSIMGLLEKTEERNGVSQGIKRMVSVGMAERCIGEWACFFFFSFIYSL